jgi:hypothetical protein
MDRCIDRVGRRIATLLALALCAAPGNVGAQSSPVRLQATDGRPGDQFGDSVALDGNLAVIGAGYDDDTCPILPCSESGSAYIFQRSGSTWAQRAKLTADDAVEGDFFGLSVDVSGITAVASSQGEDGSVYVFSPTALPGQWLQRRKLLPSPSANGFIKSVAIDGETTIAGAPATGDAGFNSGSAYVFVGRRENWTQQARLTAADADRGDSFGDAVDVWGDLAIVGAPGDDDLLCPGSIFGPGNCGAAYIFQRIGTSWDSGLKLTASDIQRGSDFGLAVAIHRETAVVGARFAGEDRKGRVYVFEWNEAVWVQQEPLGPDEGAPDSAQFGSAVALEGNTLVVGARLEQAAYVFRRGTSGWSFIEKLSRPGSVNERFADGFETVAVSEGFTLVGARGRIETQQGPGPEKGRVYAFELREPSRPAVLFMPGIIASKLFRGPTPELVFPRKSKAFFDTFLTPEGTRDRQVYPREEELVLVDPRGAGEPVYEDFVPFMDNLEAQRVISDWYAYTYDWRLPWESVVLDGTLYQPGCFTPDGDAFVPMTCAACNQALGEGSCLQIEKKIEELAGAPGNVNEEVWIVAHSMGGLITKLLFVLKPSVREHIAGVVLAASPQLGTPQGIAALLHGEEMDLSSSVPGGLLAAASVLGPEFSLGVELGSEALEPVVSFITRDAARTWPSAYQLLPFRGYFDRVVNPVLGFNAMGRGGVTESELTAWNLRYGGSIADWLGMDDFLTKLNRSVPGPLDVNTPGLVSPAIFSAAANTQGLASTFGPERFDPPLTVFQIAGWGQKTVSAIEYEPRRGFKLELVTLPFSNTTGLLPIPRVIKGHTLVKTCAGDGTVVEPSASALQTQPVFYVNLRVQNRVLGRNDKHKNILGVGAVQELLESILVGQVTPTSPLPTYISRTQPFIGACLGAYLRTRSPAEIHLFQEGRHTGPLPDSSAEDRSFEEGIPNSSYEVLGTGREVRMDEVGTYDVQIEATGVGKVLLEGGLFSGDTDEETFAIPDIPVQVGSLIDFLFDPTTQTPPLMRMDVDGDGTPDFELSTEEPPGPEVFLAVLRSTVEDLAADTRSADLPHFVRRVLADGFVRLTTRWLERAGSDLDRHPRRVQKRLTRARRTLGGYTHFLELTLRIRLAPEEAVVPLLSSARAISALLDDLIGQF